jgi:hypothetical protein
MYDVYESGCTVNMTEEQLEGYCTTGSNALIQQLLTQAGQSATGGVNTTGSLITVVAKTADASIDDPSAWVTIAGIPFAAVIPFPYDTIHRQCSSLMVGVHYTFVVARAGAVYNPQDVIVAAYADPILGNWYIRNHTDYTTSAVTTQEVIFRVSFVRYEPSSQATLMRVIVPPPILPSLGDTIFYPFRMPG